MGRQKRTEGEAELLRRSRGGCVRACLHLRVQLPPQAQTLPGRPQYPTWRRAEADPKQY